MMGMWHKQLEDAEEKGSQDADIKIMSELEMEGAEDEAEEEAEEEADDDDLREDDREHLIKGGPRMTPRTQPTKK